MGLVHDADRLVSAPRGRGWVETTIHEDAGAHASFAARRWDLAPGEATDPLEHERGEAMLFVISGSGRLVLADEETPLAEESVVWLEPGDEYRLEAGEEGLAVVAAFAELGDRS